MPLQEPFIKQLNTLTDVLEKSENKRKKILDYMQHAPCVCFMKSAETGRYEYVNQAMLDTLQRKEEEVVGKLDLDILPLEEAAISVKYDLEVIKTRRCVTVIRFFNGVAYLLVKFLVINGGESIGGLGLELPKSFRLEQFTGE